MKIREGNHVQKAESPGNESDIRSVKNGKRLKGVIYNHLGSRTSLGKLNFIFHLLYILS